MPVAIRQGIRSVSATQGFPVRIGWPLRCLEYPLPLDIISLARPEAHRRRPRSAPAQVPALQLQPHAAVPVLGTADLGPPGSAPGISFQPGPLGGCHMQHRLTDLGNQECRDDRFGLRRSLGKEVCCHGLGLRSQAYHATRNRWRAKGQTAQSHAGGMWSAGRFPGGQTPAAPACIVLSKMPASRIAE